MLSCTSSPKSFCDGISAGFDSASTSCSETCANLRSGMAAFGSAVYSKALLPVGQNISAAAEKTALFVRHKWDSLLAYLFAWGLIVTCTGLMYGFEAIALPLTIGLAGGLGAGIISGIFTVKLEHDFTLWQGINKGLNKLDPNTRQVVFSVAVTVLLAAAVVFPYVIGAGVGILIGNQLAVHVGHFDPENEENGKIEKIEMESTGSAAIAALQQELATTKEELATTKDKVETLENTVVQLKNRLDILEKK